jgi:hypothetical protein
MKKNNKKTNLKNIDVSKQRAKNVEKIIRLAWSSLESHLYWTHSKSSEGKSFHKQAIREYIEIIKTSIDLW